MSSLFRLFSLLALTLLVACGSPEERAEAHYLRAIELLAAAETDKAALELRNSLRENEGHLPARLAFARLLEEGGDVRGALVQYGLLVQRDPGSVDAHRALTALAIQVQDFGTAEVHAERAFALAPDLPDVRAYKASVDFRRGDTEAAREMAEGVVAEVPGLVAAHIVLIAERMAALDLDGALAKVDAALGHVPDDRDLAIVRLAILEQRGDMAAVGVQLEAMVAAFPGGAEFETALLQWRVGQGDSEGALEILYGIAARNPEDPTGYLNIAQFYLETEGAARARTELERLVATLPEPRPFQRALAQLDYAEGRSAEAIATLRALTEGTESTPEVRDLQTLLARILAETGDREASDLLVEAVLANDTQNVEALKLRAAASVDGDQTERAMQDLRTALLAAPRDAEVMTLMAMAHEREGAQELVGERLARAVEASNLGVPESLRYARYLMSEERFGPAEGVILDALRRVPDSSDLLIALGQIHIGRQDFTRARQVVGLLRELGTEQGGEAASGLELAILQQEGRLEETVALLETLAEQATDNMMIRVGLVQARLNAGDAEGARAEVDAILAEDPQSLVGRLMLAGLLVFGGEAAEAETLYRTIIAERPDLVDPHQLLAALQVRLDRREDAAATIEAGLAATGRAALLLNLKASLVYEAGDIDGSIALFEELYERDTSNVVVANNLASLISAHRADPESLERAFQVARRLRGTTVPHFQDTYGWILSRRGDHAQALTYLEPAAAALNQDPLVQVHLGRTYEALGRWDEARAALERGVALAGPESALPQIAAARETIAEIDARPPEPEPGSNG